jgi:hypothetical protein
MGGISEKLSPEHLSVNTEKQKLKYRNPNDRL